MGFNSGFKRLKVLQERSKLGPPAMRQHLQLTQSLIWYIC